MRYFTKEELENIAKRIVENPTPAILKELDEEYNGKPSVQKMSVQNNQTANNDLNRSEMVNNGVNNLNNLSMMNQSDNFGINKAPQSNNFQNNETVAPQFNNQFSQPQFSNGPELTETNLEGQMWNINTEPVNQNMMTTTDNFSNNQNSNMMNFNNGSQNMPFFNPSTEAGNSNNIMNQPLPIHGEPSPNMINQTVSNQGMPNQGMNSNNMPNQNIQSMFGELERNYN